MDFFVCIDFFVSFQRNGHLMQIDITSSRLFFLGILFTSRDWNKIEIPGEICQGKALMESLKVCIISKAPGLKYPMALLINNCSYCEDLD